MHRTNIRSAASVVLTGVFLVFALSLAAQETEDLRIGVIAPQAAGTVTAAAEQLHVAQPALSRQIKTLERELKLTLFEPQGSRLALTSQRSN